MQHAAKLNWPIIEFRGEQESVLISVNPSALLRTASAVLLPFDFLLSLSPRRSPSTSLRTASVAEKPCSSVLIRVEADFAELFSGSRRISVVEPVWTVFG